MQPINAEITNSNDAKRRLDNQLHRPFQIVCLLLDIKFPVPNLNRLQLIFLVYRKN